MKYLAFILEILHITVSSACPPGWKNFTDSCYLFHTSSRSTWIDATQRCAVHNSHIVFIETADEDMFIKNQLKQMISTHGDSDSATWTGGTDELFENNWVWYGDDVPIKEYTNWYPGEPDSGDGEHDEDCICLVGSKDFKWQDYRCSKHFFYVCERPRPGISIIG